ncbi:MAG: 30S ribosomal protein S3 [Candidatus Omnitrophica bacterium]|nr:30S ribosomal protein S3 [Candidatus Omnitrophota bacterium]
MGQKVHPVSYRLGYIRQWDSRWYADKASLPKILNEDMRIRRHVKKNFAQAAIARTEIERSGEKIRVFVHTARPGVLIGRRGTEIDRLRDDLEKIAGREVQIEIREIKNAAIEAQLVAENICFQLEKRVSHRRAMKKAVSAAMEAGAGGVRVHCGGRLGGAEMSRREGYHEGKVPLHTLRADVDYGFSEARTTAGAIGVRVHIYKGEILDPMAKARDEAAERKPQRRRG